MKTTIKKPVKADWMPSFENAFSPLHGFVFANGRSQRNALWALFWGQRVRAAGEDEVIITPLVLIIGPPGSGKSKLAMRITQDGMEMMPPQGPEMLRKQLNRCALKSEPFAVWDRPPSFMFESTDLAQFITCACISCRTGKNSIQRVARRTLVIMTANNPVLPPDLARRALVIELAAARDDT